VLKPVLFHRLRSRELLVLLLVLAARRRCTGHARVSRRAYSGTVVRVEWEVSNEVDVTGFELARRSATETSYSVVSTAVATGQRRHSTSTPTCTAPPPPWAPLHGSHTCLTVRSPAGDQSYHVGRHAQRRATPVKH
jgi:hypothetical protein